MSIAENVKAINDEVNTQTDLISQIQTALEGKFYNGEISLSEQEASEEDYISALAELGVVI